MYHRISILLFSVVFSFTVVSCDLSTDFEEQDVATAVINAEFFDEISAEPIADIAVTVSAEFEDSGNIFEQGTINTDENGEFEAGISSDTETVITTLEFTLTYNDQTFTFTEEVDLLVQFEEPYDQVNLTFNVEADLTPDPE